MKFRFGFFINLLLIITTNSFAQWVKLGSPNSTAPAVSLSSIGSNIFAASNYGFHRSTDNGVTWSDAVGGLPAGTFGNISVNSIAVNGTTLFCSIFNKGVFRSTDNGTNWSTVNTGLTSLYVNQVLVSGGNLYVATMSGVYKSTNSGTNWTVVNSGFTYSTMPVNKLATNGTNLYAGTSYDGVFLSTNGGTNWNSIASTAALPEVSELSASGAYVYVRSGGDLYQTSNNGANWSVVFNDSDNTVGNVLANGSNVYVDVFQKGLFVSTDYGATWSNRTTGLSVNPSFFSFSVIGTDFYAAVNMDVWKRPLTDFTTSLRNISEIVPKVFLLDQNFPNPFNSSTNIRFSVPERSDVRLTVYDVIGHEISFLQGGVLEAGLYEQSFNASKLSSGIYFYTIDAVSKQNVGKIFSETKKMILMK